MTLVYLHVENAYGVTKLDFFSVCSGFLILHFSEFELTENLVTERNKVELISRICPSILCFYLPLLYC